MVSPGSSPQAPARLLLAAHLDAARTGAAWSPRAVALVARLDRALPFPFSPSRLLFWSLAFLVPVLAVRAAGVDSALISALQLPSTLVLLVAIFAFVDIELSEIVPGANDNASGVATAISLAEELAAEPPANLDLWVLLTGGEEALMTGMRAFLTAHREQLDPASTYVICLDSVGRGEVRFEIGEGPAVTYELDSRLTELCAAIAEAGEHAATPLRHGFATDALPARLRRIPATTITCLEPGAVLPANFHTPADLPEAIEPEALERVHAFALELIRRLDHDASRRTREPQLAAAA